MKKIKPSPSWLTKKARRGFKGYPIATVAFYGPTADLATKIVVSIVPDERSQPDLVQLCASEGTDTRTDAVTGEKISDFLRQHHARSVIIADGIIGCPHEEGIDY